MKNLYSVGKQLETLAEADLLSKYPISTQVIARNWRWKSHCEIDRILRIPPSARFPQGVLIFVEVRFRKDGRALESVAGKKSAAFIRSVNVYLAQTEGDEEVRADLWLGHIPPEGGTLWEILEGLELNSVH